MKKSLLLFVSVLFFSCLNDKAFDSTDANLFKVEEVKNTKMMTFYEMYDFAPAEGVFINADAKSGNNCKLIWNIEEGITSECSVMIAMTEKSTIYSTKDVNRFYTSLIASDFFEKTNTTISKYIRDNYGIVSDTEITRAKVDFSEEQGMLTVSLLTPGGEEISVMGIYDVKNGGGTVIECIGTCGCVPEYYHDTNKTACSCSPCMMRVTPPTIEP